MNLQRCVFFFLVFFGGEGLQHSSEDEEEFEDEELIVLFGGLPGFLFGGRSLAPDVALAEATTTGVRQSTDDNDGGIDFCLELLLLLVIEWLAGDGLTQGESPRVGDGLAEEQLEFAGSDEEPPDS